MSSQRFAAGLGFAFAAAWIGFGFGDAILCLIGAGAFYAVGRFMAGNLDVEEVRARVEGARAGFSRGEGGGTGAGTAPTRSTRAR